MGKCPASRMSANPAPNSSNRTMAEATPVPPPHEDLDDISVTNSEVESVINHRRLKEAMRILAFSDQEFSALSTVDAYIPAAQDRLAGVTQLSSKDIHVRV